MNAEKIREGRYCAFQKGYRREAYDGLDFWERAAWNDGCWARETCLNEKQAQGFFIQQESAFYGSY